MIYNENKIYAKVWKVTPSENGKYIDIQITTSERDADNNYRNSSWFPRCIGKSVNTLKGLKREDRIIITKSKFTNEKRTLEDGSIRSFFRFLILEAEIEGNEERNHSNPKVSKNQDAEAQQKKDKQEIEEECPW